MYISMNWISDYVDFSGLDKENLIHRFSLSTAEVENEIFRKGENISGIVVAEIKSVKEHPKSHKLHLLKVDAGEAELTDVVCGAPNVRVGMKTAFAKLGAQVGDITIAPRELAGYTSYGMCCSERELGISDADSGIIDITDDIPCGTDIKSVYGIDDIVFEVDNKSLTNRPDLWGHYGIAREFAAIAKRPLKPLEKADLSVYDALEKPDVKIEDPLCLRYTCVKFDNVTRHVSPVDMRIRLFYCGMRPINFLADMTNYLMLEMGQPMHAFDSRKAENIRIKRFDTPFDFKTLDGVSRKIDSDTLMICSGENPVAIAGIMGGLDSEIVDDTTSLTLESATFDAVSVRKSSARLSHRTDASVRYEKSLDPELTLAAASRFVKLLMKYDSGVKVTSSVADEYAYHYKKVTLEFDKSFVDRYTGIDIDDETIISTLNALGFDVKLENGHFTVGVPSWRATKDVTIKADIIEEITRIYGYDNFKINTAVSPLYPIRTFNEKNTEEQLKDSLVKRASLHEVHSYIWAYSDEYKKLGIEVEDNVKLLNATNPNIETLRRSMIPTQLCQIKTNALYAPDFGIFEIGRVIDGVGSDGLCREHKKLAITLFSKTKQTEELYFELINIISVAVDDIKHKKLSFSPVSDTHGYIHPKNHNGIFCDGIQLGIIGVVHPTVAKKIDKKASVVFLELDVGLLSDIKAERIVYEEASKYPSMEIDLTFISDTFAPIAEAIGKADSPLIKKFGVVDTYRDITGRSVSVRILFSHKDRTLVRDEVMAVVDGIVEDLKSSGITMKL